MLQEKILYPEAMPKGQIKIELFDELTGRKVDEVNTHNFISKAVGSYLYRLVIKGLFIRNKATGGRNVYGDIKDVFQTLVLTDASHAEDPDNEWLLKGKEIGYAHTHETYSGSDVLRGTYNTKESYTNLERVHMVFDFPSHAGNGVFQSLYFIGESEVLVTLLPNYFNRPLQYNTAGKYHNDLIYVLGNDGVTIGAIGSSSSNKLRVFDKQFNLLNEYNLPSNFEDFEIVGDKIYFVRTSNSQPLHVADLNNPAVATPVSVSLPNNYYARGIVWNGSKFIVSSSSGSGSSSSTHQITELDNNFNVINNKDIGSLYNASAKLRLEEGQLLITTSYTENIKRLHSDYSFSNFYTPSFLCTFDDKMLLNNGFVIPKMNIASRALLDEPVAKTDQYTMKITYDFILE